MSTDKELYKLTTYIEEYNKLSCKAMVMALGGGGVYVSLFYATLEFQLKK